MEYYLFFNEEQKGPFTLSQLQSMWASGIITGLTLYWQHGFDEWQPLSAMIDSLEPPQAPAYIATTTPTPVSTQTYSDVLGVIIMLLPLASAALMWFWISSMNLLHNPDSTLVAITIITVLTTSILMAVEASQLGMENKRGGKPTTGPVGWFFCGLLLWIVAMPAYLYTRSKYGVRNFVVGGLLSALAFCGVALGLFNQIEQKRSVILRNLNETNKIGLPQLTSSLGTTTSSPAVTNLVADAHLNDLGKEIATGPMNPTVEDIQNLSVGMAKARKILESRLKKWMLQGGELRISETSELRKEEAIINVDFEIIGDWAKALLKNGQMEEIMLDFKGAYEVALSEAGFSRVVVVTKYHEPKNVQWAP